MIEKLKAGVPDPAQGHRLPLSNIFSHASQANYPIVGGMNFMVLYHFVIVHGQNQLSPSSYL